MINWQRIRGRDLEGQNALVLENPDVLLEARIDRARGVVERLIVAIFHRPGRAPEPLMLNRGELVIGGDTRDPFRLSKLLLEHEWSEHVARGEVEILREMWAGPMLSQTERDAIRAKYERIAAEGRERASKLLEQRKHATASSKRPGGKVLPS
jgi:hypothetical protein